MENRDSFEARMDTLSKAYKEHIAQVERTLDVFLAEGLKLGDENNQDPLDLESLRENIHKLAGSASLFGLGHVGEAAATAETALMAMMSKGRDVETLNRGAEVAVQRLKALIVQALSSP